MDFLGPGNHTVVTEFILLGLTDGPVLRVILFVIILCIYLVTISGNLSTIVLIRTSAQLHHPMYFFLSPLAFADICLSTSVIHNMLVNFLVQRNPISYHGCGMQLGSIAVFGAVECFLLAVMAYDRFVATRNPLLYSNKMSTRVCVQFLIVAYVGGFLNSCSFTSSFYVLLFCGPNHVNHFFCDFAPLVEVSCSDSSIPAAVPSFVAGAIVVATVLVILVTYIYILITILKMNSNEGCHKAFSTCTDHLIAVILYFGTVTFVYVMPKSTFSSDQNKVASVFYNVVIPMLNPIIYSLRNSDIKEALKREVGRIFS